MVMTNTKKTGTGKEFNCSLRIWHQEVTQDLAPWHTGKPLCPFVITDSTQVVQQSRKLLSKALSFYNQRRKMRHCMQHRMSALSVTRVPPEAEIYEAQKGLINPFPLKFLWHWEIFGIQLWEGGPVTLYVPIGKVEHPKSPYSSFNCSVQKWESLWSSKSR